MSLRPIDAPLVPPRLRLVDQALPPYRFVPGLNPHPFRHPHGHMYTDGSPPTPAGWDPAAPWHQDRGWLRGLDLFDHRYWWESHEAWEAVWHQGVRGTPYAELLQGMIQVAAALLKSHSGQPDAAIRLLDRASVRLARVVGAGPEACRGLDLVAAEAHWRAYLAGGDWPPPLGD